MLREVLKREPEPEDAQKLTSVHYEGSLSYGVEYNGKPIGYVKKSFNCRTFTIGYWLLDEVDNELKNRGIWNQKGRIHRGT